MPVYDHKGHEEMNAIATAQPPSVETRLLDCPFCGSKPDVNPAGQNDPYDEDYVQCSNRDCVLFVDFSATVPQWNARSPRQAEPEAVDAERNNAMMQVSQTIGMLRSIIKSGESLTESSDQMCLDAISNLAILADVVHTPDASKSSSEWVAIETEDDLPPEHSQYVWQYRNIPASMLIKWYPVIETNNAWWVQNFVAWQPLPKLYTPSQETKV